MNYHRQFIFDPYSSFKYEKSAAAARPVWPSELSIPEPAQEVAVD
jgi:hypothetical protein